jgi:tetratricopeptide (TPR) repeat protein
MRGACVLGLWLAGWHAAQSQTTGPAEILEQANSSYRQLHSEDAVRLYRQYLQLYPDRADVHVFLGAALLNLNRLDEALAEAARALLLDGKLAKGYLLEGRVWSEQQQWDSAMRAFTTAVTLQPGDPDAWYFSGRTAYEATHFKAAINSFQRGLAIDPAQSRFYEGLGQVYEALGRSSEAEHAYRQALDRAGQSYRPSYVLGRFLFKQGRDVESVPYFATALQLSPSAPEVRFELGRALYQTGKLSDSVKVLDGGLPTRDCRIYSLLAKVLRQVGDATSADSRLAEWRRCSAEQN